MSYSEDGAPHRLRDRLERIERTVEANAQAIALL